MLPYWLMFMIPALVALATGLRAGFRKNWRTLHAGRPLGGLVLIVPALLIGWRFQVGGDWLAYIRYLNQADGLAISDISLGDDPGYWLVNIISSQMGWGVIGVNAICGLLFSIGLVFFSRHLPRPWLALAVAVPYMVIVVAMGYSRQGVALGLAMLGLVAGARKIPTFVIWILLGATFTDWSAFDAAPRLEPVFCGLIVVGASLLLSGSGCASNICHLSAPRCNRPVPSSVS